MPRLGELLVQHNLVTQEVIDKALQLQVGGNHRLGHILVKMKALTADQLADMLSAQLDIPICDIATLFSNEVRNILPRYLCRQYGVLPLAMHDNNVLELAMADPADDEAIRDLERYTRRLVSPRLARQTEIEREIPQRIPLGMKDVFSPRASSLYTRLAVSVCLVFIAVLATITFQYINDVTYGSRSITANSIIYKNHDLMVEFTNDGKVNLLGRASFAQSSYLAAFNGPKATRAFLESRAADLSEKQRTWLDWVFTTERAGDPAKALATSK